MHAPMDPSLEGLSSSHRGFLTWVAGSIRRPLDEVWAHLRDQGTTRLAEGGRHLVTLDLSPIGAALRLAGGPKRRLTLPIGGLESLEELDVSGLDLDALDCRVLPGLRILRCARNRLRELDLGETTALEVLDCSENALLVLDLRRNRALRELRCESNKLGALVLPEGAALRRVDVARNELMVLDLGEQPELVELHCTRNALVRLSVRSAPRLEVLDASRNDLPSLEHGPLPALRALHVGRNRIHALDTAAFPAVEELRLHGNYVESLDLRPHAALALVDARANQLASLSLGHHPRLVELVVSDNRLDALDPSGAPALAVLRCGGNLLRSLSLAPCPRLLQLDCSDNPLRELDPGAAPELVDLRAEGTDLAALDIRGNPALARLQTRRGSTSPAIAATPEQRLRLRELREAAGLGTGATDPAAMSPWELHDLAASIRGRDAEQRLLAVVTAPGCDLGTAAMVYWTTGPHPYLAYAARDEVPEYERPGWDLLWAIEERVRRGGFGPARIPYDPRDDRHTGPVSGVDRTVDPRPGRVVKRGVPLPLLEPVRA